MGIGIQPTKVDIDFRGGSVAAGLETQMAKVAEFKYFLDGQSDAALVTLGYTTDEVAVLRSAYGDLALLVQIYQGLATLPTAKDFRTFARQLWGMGA